VPQHRIEQALLHAAGGQARADLGEDRGVEAGVGQLQRETLRPVDTGADGVGGLSIGETCDVLQHTHERAAPRRLRRAATRREERRALLVGEQGPALARRACA